MARYIMPPAELPNYQSIAPFFYHVMNLPDGIVTSGCWDLRGREDDYFGHFNFKRKSVLELGPASGFLTAAMERRGAIVTAVELPDDGEWDFVPYATDAVAEKREMQRSHMPLLRSTFWFTHRALQLRAKMVHAHATDLPHDLGRFDVVVLASVLLHTKNPHDVIRQCAQFADTMLIVEPLYLDLEDKGPVIRFHPNTSDRLDSCTWWHFSTSFVREYLNVLGFTQSRMFLHRQRNAEVGRDADMFTMIASRGHGPA